MKKILILTLCLILLTGCGKSEPNDAAKTYEIVVYNTGMTVTFDENTRSAGTIRDGNDIYHFEYKINGDLEIIYPNGSKAAFNEKRGIGTGSIGSPVDDYPSVIAFSWALDDIVESKSEKSEGRGRMLLGILLVVSGCIMMFSTKGVWMLNHGWKYKNAQPSEIYLGITKVMGGIVAFIGIMAFITAL